jgi:hypothetical protein
MFLSLHVTVTAREELACHEGPRSNNFLKNRMLVIRYVCRAETETITNLSEQVCRAID